MKLVTLNICQSTSGKKVLKLSELKELRYFTNAEMIIPFRFDRHPSQCAPFADIYNERSSFVIMLENLHQIQMKAVSEQNMQAYQIWAGSSCRGPMPAPLELPLGCLLWASWGLNPFFEGS